ncbi:MAG TPA: GAF domain-containing protein, partial [Allocoleopsis sp.]
MDSPLPDHSPLQGNKWAGLPVDGREQLALEVCSTVASAISAGICIMDTQLRCIRSNAVLAEISTLPEAVHAGMPLIDLLPELAGQVEPLCQQVFQTGKAVKQVELYIEQDIEQAADHRLRAVQPARSWFVSCFPLFHANSCWAGLLIVEVPSPYRSRHSPLPDLETALAPARLSSDAPIIGAALSQNPEEGMLSQNIQNIMQPQDISSLEKLQQQVERERLINKVAMQILQSNHLNDILQVAVGEVRQFLQADRVIIGRCHLGGRHQVVSESVATGWSSSLGATLPDAWLNSLLNGEQVLAQQAASEETGDCAALRLPTDLNQWAASQQIKSWLAMPILLNEQIWGFIAVHQCSGVRQWQSLEIELLEKLTTQLAIAIQQAELHNHIQHLNDDLENQVQARTAELQLAFEFEATLKRITDRVRDSLDEDLILQAAVRELVQVLKISGCNASLYDLEAETSTTCYEYTTSISPYQGRVLQFSSVPELYTQLLKGQYFQFCSLLPNPERGLSSMLACPILDDQGVIG